MGGLSDETPPTPVEPPAEMPGKPLPLQLELPGSIAETRDSAADALGADRARSLHPRRAAARFVLWSLGVVCAVGGVAAWALPVILRRECIEVAAEHGIDLAVERVRIVPAGLQLYGVHATSRSLPGASASTPEIDVETGDFRPRVVTLRGGGVVHHGTPGELAAGVAKWRASPSGGDAGAWSPMSVVLDGVDVEWHSPGAGALHVGASDVHATFTWSAVTADAPPEGAALQGHVRSERVVVDLPDGDRLGPWSVDAERTMRGLRVRLALDPEVPDSSFLLLVGDGESITAADLVVPRSPVARLGVRGPSFASVVANAQLEATLHYAVLGSNHADVSSRGALHGIRLPGLADPVDVTWEGVARGDPTLGIDVKNAHLVVGAVDGALRGTWKMFDDGARVTLAWTLDALGCADAGGTFSFDSRDLTATQVELKLPSASRGCGPLRRSAARGE
ncbi:MAG TPA: hypothetical protein VGM06_21475 [Polyangiaceae bacterium]